MSHLPALVSDLALILVMAAITTVIFKKLKQPVVLGYILAGLLVEPQISFLPNVQDNSSISIWAEIGIIFLLFNLGLEFSIKKLVKIAPTAAPTGLFETLMMMAIGYVVGGLLGWSQMDRIFLGGMIAISSTTIIIRAFEELNLKTQKYTGMVMGVLIIEDIIAVLLLVILSTVAVSQNFQGEELVLSVVQLAIFLILSFVVGIYLIPTILNKLDDLIDDETLLVIALGLCLGMVVLANFSGFSSALGAFLMGTILSETNYVERIGHQLKSLKDLFGAVFFVSVGMMINPIILWENIVPVIVLTIVVLFGKTIAVSIGMMITGQPLRPSLQSGMSMSQIGEFSFIIATLGLSLGVISNVLYPIAVGVSVITTFTTPYFIKYSENVYQGIEKILPNSWLLTIQRYANSSQNISDENEWKEIVKSYLSVILINALVAFGIIVVAYYFVLPFESKLLGDSTWNEVGFFFVVLALITPFIWGILKRQTDKDRFEKLWNENPLNKGPLLSLELGRLLVALVILTFLLSKVFSTVIVLVIALIVVFVILSVFSTRIQDSYNKIEKRFYTNLNQKEIAVKERVEKLNGWMPWDTHFIDLHVTAASEFVGKPLKDLQLREKYGVNIAIIDRKVEKIYVPSKDEVILPGDIITIIGDDAQLSEVKPLFEVPIPKTKSVSHKSIHLGKIVVSENDWFVGQSIQESKLREFTHGMVIGIDKNGEKDLNPPSNTILEVGDIVYVVGDLNNIKSFKKNN